MTRLVCISDTHGLHKKVNLPAGDILVFAGDATNHGTAEECAVFAAWFEKQDFKHRVVIAGNHDEHLYANWFTQENTHYLYNNGVELEGLTFWGSPITPTFFNWFHMADRGDDINRHWRTIWDNTDVLVTHGPALGALDYTSYGHTSCGCADLAAALDIVKPKVHIFGHVHESYGTVMLNKIQFVNASVVGNKRKHLNAPIIVDL